MPHSLMRNVISVHPAQCIATGVCQLRCRWLIGVFRAHDSCWSFAGQVCSTVHYYYSVDLREHWRCTCGLVKVVVVVTLVNHVLLVYSGETPSQSHALSRRENIRMWSVHEEVHDACAAGEASARSLRSQAVRVSVLHLPQRHHREPT